MNAGENVAVGMMADFGTGAQISIGDNSGIAQHSIVKGSKPIKIGKGVVMGPRVMLLSSSHNFEVKNNIWTDSDASAPIEISDDVFIGAGSIILGGVKIESNVIIAAGSVVISDVPSNVMVGGVPAKIIKNL